MFVHVHKRLQSCCWQFLIVPLVQCVDSLTYNMLCCFLEIIMMSARIVLAALTPSWKVQDWPHQSNLIPLQSPLATDADNCCHQQCLWTRADLDELSVGSLWSLLWIICGPVASTGPNVVPPTNITRFELLLLRLWISEKKSWNCSGSDSWSDSTYDVDDESTLSLTCWLAGFFFTFCDALVPAGFFITVDALMPQMFTMIPPTSWWPKVHIAMATISTYM